MKSLLQKSPTKTTYSYWNSTLKISDDNDYYVSYNCWVKLNNVYWNYPKNVQNKGAVQASFALQWRTTSSACPLQSDWPFFPLVSAHTHKIHSLTYFRLHWMFELQSTLSGPTALYDFKSRQYLKLYYSSLLQLNSTLFTSLLRMLSLNKHCFQYNTWYTCLNFPWP